MNNPIQIPDYLKPQISSAIESVDAGRVPQDLSRLYHWFENDGWDLITDAWFKDMLALPIDKLIKDVFNDFSLASNQGVKVTTITDQIRLKHARDFIEANYDSFPSVHIYPLNQQVDGTPVLCCLAVLNGYSYEADWWGVFKNAPAFVESLKTSGYAMTKENNLLTDEKILDIWNYAVN